MVGLRVVTVYRSFYFVLDTLAAVPGFVWLSLDDFDYSAVGGFVCLDDFSAVGGFEEAVGGFVDYPADKVL